jgi:hypothetical protein
MPLEQSEVHDGQRPLRDVSAVPLARGRKKRAAKRGQRGLNFSFAAALERSG